MVIGKRFVAAGKTFTVERHLRPLARRYLGVDAGDAYVDSSCAEHADNVLVRMRPERWLTVDYGKLRL